MNDRPAALIARSAITGAAARYGTLLGANIGPNIAPSGSFATMLVLSVARRKGRRALRPRRRM